MVTLPANQAGDDYTELLTEHDKEEVHYAVWQLEKGANGTEANPAGYRHIQLYIEFTRPRTFEQAKNFLGEQAHLEIPKKVRKACIAYCKKKDTRVAGPWEFGDESAKQQGKRSDLDEVKHALDSGVDVKTISDTNFSSWCRYRKSFDEYVANIRGVERDGIAAPHVIVVWGSSGCGKSRWAFMRDPSAYRAMPGKEQTMWWERYAGQNCVVFDDFADDQLSLQEFCRICDPYPCLVPVKQSSAPLRAHEFIFTSNIDPATWWHRRDAEEALPQVFRRIDHIVHLGAPRNGVNGEKIYEAVSFTPCKKCSGTNFPVLPEDLEVANLLNELENEKNSVIDLTQDE